MTFKSIKNPALREVLDWGVHIAVAVLIGFLIVAFVGQRTIVSGSSMETTLQDGDQLIIEKISPKIGNLKYGDIVTIDVSDMNGVDRSPIIKRVIGVEGDKIEVRDGKVYLNGKALKEDYINGDFTDNIREEYCNLTVKKGQIYVLGDNRTPGGSLDSRTLGPFDISRVGGKAIFRFWPFDNMGTPKKHGALYQD
ncbi:signal peptidase I [Pseudobacteroides cellulosolvens]|nr:signal peptidase I [Pseudobacteroides cellulosolvens]